MRACFGTEVHAATLAGTRGGGVRPNQDAFGIASGVSSPTLLLASVFDGHGPQGHFIARHVRDRLPAWIASCAADKTPPDADGAPQHPALPSWVRRAGGAYSLEPSGQLQRCAPGSLPADAPAWVSAVTRAFVELDGDLCTCRSTLLAASNVSPEQNGCTAVSALLGDGHLLVAGCGDSSAFLATRVASPSLAPDDVPPRRVASRPRYAARCMSVAHKPQGEEAQRVRLAGGRVVAHPGEEHIPRVWPREQDVLPGKPSFGLAVARAFGDTHWKAAGVCAAPDVTLRRVRPDDAFLLLCSDGVTDVMSGQEAVSVAANALHDAGEDVRNVAQAVVDAAKQAWQDKFPQHTRDDITVAILMLHPPPEAEAPAAAVQE